MKKYDLTKNGNEDVCVMINVTQMSMLPPISKLDLHLTYEMEALIQSSSVSSIPNHDGYFSIHVFRSMSLIGVNTLTSNTSHLIDASDRTGVISVSIDAIMGVHDPLIRYNGEASAYRGSKPLQVIYGTSKDIDDCGSIMTLFNYKSLNFSIACFRFPSYNGTAPFARLLSCLENISSMEYTITNNLSLTDLSRQRIG